MNKNKKNKGLTFLETIACVAIIFSVSSFLFYRVIKYNEKMDLEMSRYLIQTFFLEYTNRSMYENRVYSIELNTLEKYIVVKKTDTDEIERVYLPKKLKYEIPYDNVRNPKFKVDTTKNGNLSKAFTLYIFGYGDQVENRLAFYIFQKERVLKINVYLKSTLKGINYSNILDYHYSQEGENRVGWIEE
ncbi:hypothetical protein [Cetobacterium sp.]|uniref:hypothetical protein n=1 Tax=Cetobacterium sp. TaxID=2071632 RepID=UPI003AF0AAD0